MMRKKQVTAYYKQLRILIMRAKEDAIRWERHEPLLLLQGISETSIHDFFIYDKVYNKIVTKNREKLRKPSGAAKNESEQSEATTGNEETVTLPKENENDITHSYADIQLARIADALERIANAMDQDKAEREL